MHKKQHCKANKLLVKHICQCDITYQVDLVVTNHLNTLNVRPKRQKFIGYLILWWHLSFQCKLNHFKSNSSQEMKSIFLITRKFLKSSMSISNCKNWKLGIRHQGSFFLFLKVKQLLDLFSKTFLNKKHLYQFSLNSMVCKTT